MYLIHGMMVNHSAFGVHVGDGGRGLTCLEGQVSDSGSYSVDSKEVLGEEVT